MNPADESILMEKPDLVVVGAGPAGLTAAFDAQRRGFRVLVLEADPHYVGGISRTVRSGGDRFDLGGHRFFSKSERIVRWWKERLPKDFIRVPRRSRILYRRQYFDYPLRAWDAFSKLGIWTSFQCIISYVWARLTPIRPENSFADWVRNRFGHKLFEAFFRTYTEKVWGISTRDLSARWAAQRIKGLSLASAILNALRPKRAGEKTIKTLIDAFDYPRHGPGQMWERTAEEIRAAGGQILLGWKVTRIVREGGRVVQVEASGSAGEQRAFMAKQFILSMPLRETVLALTPALAPELVAAAQGLRYRDFITVALVVKNPSPFPDNWLYIHEPAVSVGRIQNFRAWSADMVAEAGTTCLGMEYFCFQGDALWTRSDEALVALASEEIVRLGLVRADEIVRGSVVRVERAYPMYVDGYEAHLALIKNELDKFSNLQVVGRNGMHKYNNQDHSMMTAMLAVENLVEPRRYDLWRVNTDAEYHEEIRPSSDA